MNFSEFTRYRVELLASRPDVLDFAETRIGTTLGPYVPAGARAVPDAKAHRCHLAEFWLTHFQLPASWSSRTNISEGVRDSLARLFQVYADAGRRVAIPADVYPRYAELASEAGVAVRTYATVPNLESASWSEADVLLLANPLKPRGSFLTTVELAEVEQWLASDASRRVVIDAVYTFTNTFEPGILQLYGTGQAIVLHSLSKTWASPLLMGVALIPEADISTLRPVFQARAPSQEQLRRAQVLLTAYRDLPGAIANGLVDAQVRAQAALPLDLKAYATASVGYLQVVPYSADELLQRFNVLALPLTAFGSNRADLSVMSVLGFVRTEG